MDLILNVVNNFNIEQIEKTEDEKHFDKNKNYFIEEDLEALVNSLNLLFRTTIAKKTTKQLGFITLFCDGTGHFWFKTSRGFHTALHESLVSLQSLIDLAGENFNEDQKIIVRNIYGKMNKMI